MSPSCLGPIFSGHTTSLPCPAAPTSFTPGASLWLQSLLPELAADFTPSTDPGLARRALNSLRPLGTRFLWALSPFLWALSCLLWVLLPFLWASALVSPSFTPIPPSLPLSPNSQRGTGPHNTPWKRSQRTKPLRMVKQLISECRAAAHRAVCHQVLSPPCSWWLWSTPWAGTPPRRLSPPSERQYKDL